MIKKIIYILFLINHIFFFATGQTLIEKNDLGVRFLKDKVDVVPGKSFFNVLILKNNSEKQLSFVVKLNTPNKWEIVGDRIQNITMLPNAELKLPVRVTVDKNAQGGVGYAIIAVINDESGNLYDSEYTFLNIPVKPKIKVKAEKSVNYFDHQSLRTKMSFTILNEGNVDETINIRLRPDASLMVENENFFVSNVFIESGQSKVLTYDVELRSDIDIERFKNHTVYYTIGASDTIINKSMWFKYINWHFHNPYPGYNVPLTIELTAYNILSNIKSKYRGAVYGKLLLKNKRQISYSFENLNRDENSSNIYTNSRVFAEYQSPKTIIFLGDYTGNVEQSMFGRGIHVYQNIKERTNISGAFTQRLINRRDNYGFYFNHKLKSPFFFELGSSYTDDHFVDKQSLLGYGKIRFKPFKYVSLSFLYGYSQTEDSRVSPNTNMGWGYKGSFSVNYKDFFLNILSNYGSPEYSGVSNGRLDAKALASYSINKKSYLNSTYSLMNLRPSYIEVNELKSDIFSGYQDLTILYNRIVFNNVNMFIGPYLVNQSTNSFYNPVSDTLFSISSTKLLLGARYYESYTERSVSLKVNYGYSFLARSQNLVNGEYFEKDDITNPFPVSEFTLSYKQKFFGIFFVYHNGPYNLNQQFRLIYGGQDTKILSIIPYYERGLFKNKVNISVRGSYINDITAKNSRLSLMSGIIYQAGKGWSFRFVNTSSVQRNLAGTGINAINTSYTSTYFEFGLKKEFNFDQPRIKYYDYRALFYKDLNGNRIHDANEPGVPNIFADIQRADPVSDAANPNYNGEYLAHELMSNQEGTIFYKNMPEGDYVIKYRSEQAIDLGSFEVEEALKEYRLGNDTVMYIPFLQRNKLFGRVNLNRTKLSALGEIPINNIKISVEGNEKTYSTLTDEEGYFEIFIPVADYYKVKVNNIFYEHFDLRQEYYIVKFNGYKNFEVSFDFDEKERKIEFDPEDFLIDEDDVADDDFTFDDIRIIKQTNLKGTVRDANSLIPIHSTVSVYNGRNELISETASSNRTGVYFTSFFAGDDYSIEVSSKGYWVYKSTLNIQQVTTFENLTEDVLLSKINIDEKIKADNLKFQKDKADLTPLARAELDNIIQLLNLNSSVVVEVSGHTDNIEALLTNPQELSLARATSVSSYLVKNGIEERRIKVVAKGSTDPENLEDSEQGRARNRRVDIKVAGF